MAKQVVDTWFNTEPSRDALRMIEPRKRRYKTAENSTEVIPQSYVLAALQSQSSDNKPQEIFIQDCFDALFYHLNRTEQLMQSGLILFDDVKRPAEYYVTQMARHKQIYDDFARTNGYLEALLFLERFGAWKSLGNPQSAKS